MGIFTRALKWVVSSLLFCSTLIAHSQTKPEEEYQKLRAQYPGEVAVYLQKSESVNYQVVNDTLRTTITVYEEIMHLGENTARYASDRIFSSSFSKVSDIEAYTLVPGKRKYERYDVSEFKESYDKDSYTFYDDTREITFTFPAVQKGAKTILKYTETIKDPRMMGVFFFKSYLPVREATYTVKYDKGIEIKPQFFNDSDITIAQSKKPTDDGRFKTVFKVSDIDKIKFDRDCPSYSHLATGVYCPVATYQTTDQKTREVITTTDQLHQWYRTFVSNILEPNDSVRALVNSIIRPEDPTLEKVRKIYYWVQSNIKYIAFEDGMRGLIPHPGSYVISKRYGDCKDMSSCIVSMLREAGVDAHYTWVGSRDLPYKYSQTPSPITDNHMIATFIHEDETYYLDATGSYTPLGFPTSMIQGKECLISLGPDNHVVKEIPVIPKEQNVMTDSVNISIADGKISGFGQVSLAGYTKVFNTYKLIKSNTNSVDKYVQRLTSKGSNKFEVSDFTVSNVDDLSKPILIDYQFIIPDYYRQVGDNIYINLVLDRSLTEALIENRTVPIENDYKYINRNVVHLPLTNGLIVETLPSDQNFEGEHFGYSIQYKVTDEAITVTKEFYVNYLLMKPESFPAWNEAISKYSKACRKAIVLKTTNEEN